MLRVSAGVLSSGLLYCNSFYWRSCTGMSLPLIRRVSVALTLLQLLPRASPEDLPHNILRPVLPGALPLPRETQYPPTRDTLMPSMVRPHRLQQFAARRSQGRRRGCMDEHQLLYLLILPVVLGRHELYSECGPVFVAADMT